MTEKKTTPAVMWITTSGDQVHLDADVVEALVLVEKTFPGAKAVWWRRGPTDRWKQP